jgi:hypothetical protein
MLNLHLPYKNHRCGLWLALLLSGCGLAQAADTFGLPYTTVGYDQSRTQLGIEYIETVADAVNEPVLVEIAPDRYSRTYRSGIDVYKMMSDEGFDDEPMVVIAPEVDLSLQPRIVVIAAYSPPVYTHVTAAQAIIDPVARGEDAIYLLISSPPEPPEGRRPKAVVKPKERRFFSTPVE